MTRRFSSRRLLAAAKRTPCWRSTIYGQRRSATSELQGLGVDLRKLLSAACPHCGADGISKLGLNQPAQRDGCRAHRYKGDLWQLAHKAGALVVDACLWHFLAIIAKRCYAMRHA